LIQEGIGHLNAGKPDNAIRSFEQAIGLNPNNGQCYYYMAQAWLAKGAVSEAKQFNSLAGDYLQDDAQWEVRVREQFQRIESLSK
jgi:tetratricopeptide (TPR) repeat protein